MTMKLALLCAVLVSWAVVAVHSQSTPPPATPSPATPAPPTAVPAATTPCGEAGLPTYFSNPPYFQCGSTVGTCGVAACVCLGGSVSATGACVIQSAVSVAAARTCNIAAVDCLVNTAVSLYTKGAANTTAPCYNWALAVVKDYSTYVFNTDSTLKKSSIIAKACNASVCLSTMKDYNTPTDSQYTCTFPTATVTPPTTVSGTPAPDTGVDVSPAACLLTGAPTYFMDAPFGSCSSVALCGMMMCSCVGGSINTTDGNCLYPATLATATKARSCISNGVTCMLTAALDYYDTAKPDSKCYAWSVKVAAAYAAYYNASTKNETALFQSCYMTTCYLLRTGYGDVLDYSAACGFTGVDLVPKYVAPPGPPPFVCPDQTVTLTGGIATCACSKNAAISNLSASFNRPVGLTTPFDVSFPLTAVASAAYAVAKGNCSGFDFSPYVTYQWVVSKASSPLMPIIVTNSSALYIRPGMLETGETYVLAVLAYGFSGVTPLTFTFVTKAPAPVVTLNFGSAARVSTKSQVVIRAAVTDLYPAGATSQWSCQPSAQCPQYTSDKNSLTVAANTAAAGTYTFNFTYKATSVTTALTFIVGLLPLVSITPTSAPVAPTSPPTYLSSQPIFLSAAVKYGSPVIVQWYIDGVLTPAYNDQRNIKIDAATLTASTCDSIATSTGVVIRVVANDNLNGTYGESSIAVRVLPAYTFTLSLSSSNAMASKAVGYTDTITFGVTQTSNTAAACSGVLGTAIDYSFAFYDTDPVEKTIRPKPLLVSAGNQIKAPAVAAPGLVTFTALLRVNGLVAAAANATITIENPAANSVADDQVLALGSISNVGNALAATTNAISLLGLVSNGTKKAMLASAMLSSIMTSISAPTSLSSEQQGQMMNSLAAALSSAPNPTAEANITKLLRSSINSDNFDVTNSRAALSALSAMTPTSVQSVLADLALQMSRDPNQQPGVVNKLTVGSLSVATYKDTAANIVGKAVPNDGTTMTLPSDLKLNSSVSDGSILAVAASSIKGNPFDNSTTATSVVSYDLSVDGNRWVVSNLDSPVVIDFGAVGGNVMCKFWNETSAKWSMAGVTTEVTNGGVRCKTTHFTAFSTFVDPTATPSSAATLLLSVAVIVLSFALQVAIS